MGKRAQKTHSHTPKSVELSTTNTASFFFPPHTHTHTPQQHQSLSYFLSLSLSVVLPDFVVEFHLLLVSECGGAADITLASHYHLSHSLSSSLSNTHTHTKTLIAHTHTQCSCVPPNLLSLK